MLRDVLEPPQVAHGVIVSRIKIMARLDIAEKRQPQDGRIALRLAGRSVDVRVSILPTAHGERVVLRLLDKQAGRLDFTSLGMADTTLATLRDLVRQPLGIFFVTGPSGPGKTKRPYAALGQLDAKSRTSSPSRTRSSTTWTASARPRSTRASISLLRGRCAPS